MKIILDGFGGDLAPLAPLQAAADAVRELGVTVTVTGDTEKLSACAAEHNIPLEGISFAQASLVMPVEAEPTSILKQYADSSMAVGLRLVADGEGDAFVSAGSTGALIVGGTFLVKRIKGVKRPALGTSIPMKNGFYLLIDSGANHDVRPEMLAQFAVMGTAYQRALLGTENPRVGLVNIGTEDNKGTDLQVQALPLLREAPINFVGNVEARELPLGGCDVAVCDGFTGNIILKLTEGLASFFGGAIKDVLMTNTLTKISALAIKKPFSEFKKTLDYREIGGVPILGVRSPVIKAHGASDARALKNAIRQATYCVERDIIGEIERGISTIRAKGEEA
jgi:glycerol-3-phosphate acyltransferase PlsX